MRKWLDVDVNANLQSTMQHRSHPGHEETKGLIEAESAGIARTPAVESAFVFVRHTLPFGPPRETLATQEPKIAALLKPLGKTGLMGDANRWKSPKGKGKKC